MSAGKLRAAMVARRVRGGFNASESEVLLADLIRSHKGGNLAAALVYQRFATERQAGAFLLAAGTERVR